MAKQIAKLLKASIQETSDLKEIAKMLAKKGRGGDTMLAHITPKEAAVLKESGGAGTVNPDTGLLEFYDGFNIADYADFDMPNIRTGGYATKAQPELSYGFNAPATYEYSDPIGEIAQTATGKLYPQVDFSYMPKQQAGAAAGGFEEFPAGMSSAASLPQQAPAGAPMDAAALQQYYSTPEAAAAFKQYYDPQLDVTGRYVPSAGALSMPSAGVAPERSALQRYIGDPLKQLKAETGITGADLARVGIAGAGAIAGYQQQKKAARQIEQAVAEQKALAEPYRQRGEELQRAAMSGEMTPQSAQAFQALRAQLAQGAEARGGVGAAQAAAQLEAFRTNLLQNQYDFGLKVSQIGDQVALGAIRTGMQLDQQLGQANQQFYAQLASIAAGGTYGYQPPQPTRG